MKRLNWLWVGAFTLVILSVVGVGVTKFAQDDVRPQVEQETLVTEPTVEELLRLTNGERSKVGAKPLVLDPLLNKSAQIKAEDMVNKNYFEHINSEGEHGYELITEVGKQCQRRSENIWLKGDEFSAQMAVTSWKNSDVHYKAMVNSEYDSTGFGIAGDKIVQHFCDEN